MAFELGERGPRATAISNAMTKLHRDHYGRGPDSVRTILGEDHVICFLEDIYTPAERTLVEAGELQAVRDSRHAFQRAMESRFTDAVEGTTGRTVRAFLSQTHIAPDISCEVFVLEPAGSEPADQGEA
jgi:uncharacterized protein YbcI